MKKLLFILSLVLILPWCSLNNNSTRQQIQWTVFYYNLEKDLWSWKKSIEKQYHAAVFIILDPEYAFIVSDPENKNYKETIWKILIWCVSWNKNTLYRKVIQIKHKPFTIVVWANDLEIKNKKEIELPEVLDQKRISAKITLPIDLYITNQEELTDQWKINNCLAHSDIKDIKTIK